MQQILKIIKGSLVGLGSILPGVSGGMIAAAFDIYKELIEALNNFTKHPIKSILSIWQYLLGIGIGIVFGFILIKTILVKAPFPATLLFIGLILGSIPSLLKEAKPSNNKVWHIIILLLMSVLMILMLFLKPNNIDSELSIIKMLIAGGLIAISFIIPGLSGTMILMAIGFYNEIVELISLFIEQTLKFNFDHFFDHFILLTFMGIGLIITALLLAKLISFALKKAKTYFYFGILGIVFISPINILFTLKEDLPNIYDNLPILQYIIGGILLVLGIYIAIKMSNGVKDETKEIEVRI